MTANLKFEQILESAFFYYYYNTLTDIRKYINIFDCISNVKSKEYSVVSY